MPDHAAPQVPVLPVFQQDQAPSHPSNSQVLRMLSDAALPEPVCKAYGPWLVGQVTLARAELLMALGATLGCYTGAQFDGEQRPPLSCVCFAPLALLLSQPQHVPSASRRSVGLA